MYDLLTFIYIFVALIIAIGMGIKIHTTEEPAAAVLWGAILGMFCVLVAWFLYARHFNLLT